MGSADRKGRRWLAASAVYGALVVLGAVEGLIGSFQYSHAAGPVPLAAIIACAGDPGHLPAGQLGGSAR